MKQRERTRPKASSTQERLIERETFQYVTTNPRKYGVASTRNERQLAKAMDSLHMQQNKRLAELSSQIYEVKVHQWKLKEVDETSWGQDEKLLGSAIEEVSDETEPKNRGVPMTRAKNGKQSTTQGTRPEAVLPRVGVRQNRPMTSGNITEKMTASRSKNTSKIIKYDNGHNSQSSKVADLHRITNGSNRQSSTHGVTVDYALRDVPVWGDPKGLKHHKYKSYNLMNAQKSTGKQVSPPRDSTKQTNGPNNDLHGVIDMREKIAGNRMHHGKINVKSDAQLHSGHFAKPSETNSMNHGHRTTVIPHYLTHLHYYEDSFVHHEGGATVSDQETEDNEQRRGAVDENWAETLKTCRYLRKPRGYETPDITIESIFQNE